MSATLSVRKLNASAPVRLDADLLAGAVSRGLLALAALVVPARPGLADRLVRDAGLAPAPLAQGLDWTVGEYRRLPL